MRDLTIETVTTFKCSGVIFSVLSFLGVRTNYTVYSSLGSTCIIVAKAPNNPKFLPSAPLVVEILTPLYFEGTAETAFYTLELLPIFVRSANDAKLNINFVIVCGSANKSIPIITSTTTINYPLSPDLVGDCTLITTNVPVGYIPIQPIQVTISPSIFFVTPTQNTQYSPGSTISATLIATDDNSTLSVTVKLTCNSSLVEFKTQNIMSTFSFAPNNEIYGSCVLSLADVEGYYTEKTVTVGYSSVLSFVLPKSGTLVPPGTTYDIQVNGTSGTSSVSVSVVGKCQAGGNFTEHVQLGVMTQVTLGESYQGICTLVATTSTPYFTPVTTTIHAYTPLNPAEKARIAESFVLNERILDLTNPYP